MTTDRRAEPRELPSLAAAYRATRYRVEHPDGPFVLRIGVRSRTLDRLLTRHGHHTWAFLTAWNPLSEITPPEQNAARQAWLEHDASRRWWPIFAGRGEGDGWPAEVSLLILGISEFDASSLARIYRQAAVVVGTLGEPARLVWVTSPR
jgi:hypothetical protein